MEIRPVLNIDGAYYIQKELPTQISGTSSIATFVFFSKWNYENWKDMIKTTTTEDDLGSLHVVFLKTLKNAYKSGNIIEEDDYDAYILCVYSDILYNESLDINMLNFYDLEMFSVFKKYLTQDRIIEVESTFRNPVGPNHHLRLSVQLRGFGAIVAERILKLDRNTIFVSHSLDRMSKILTLKAKSIPLHNDDILENHFTCVLKSERSIITVLKAIKINLLEKIERNRIISSSTSPSVTIITKINIIDTLFKKSINRINANARFNLVQHISAINRIIDLRKLIEQNSQITKFDTEFYIDKYYIPSLKTREMIVLSRDFSNDDDRKKLMNILYHVICDEYISLIDKILSFLDEKLQHKLYPQIVNSPVLVDDTFANIEPYEITIYCKNNPSTLSNGYIGMVTSNYEDTYACAMDISLLKCFFDDTMMCNRPYIDDRYIIPEHNNNMLVSKILRNDIIHNSTDYSFKQISLENIRDEYNYTSPSSIQDIGLENYYNSIPDDHLIFSVKMYLNGRIVYQYLLIVHPDLPISYHTQDMIFTNELSGHIICKAHAYGEHMITHELKNVQKKHVFFQLNPDTTRELILFFDKSSNNTEDWTLGSSIDRVYNDIDRISNPHIFNLRKMSPDHNPWLKRDIDNINHVTIQNRIYNYDFICPKYFTTFLDTFDLNNITFDRMELVCDNDFLMKLI